ncbi:uncharacterized protein K02A2.6-like [Crotalus tigris]|uniref:uncharacterized protein K02A2.6-like n=1 Tax=Crotalus tigris TaxID=88082 RepID=UPI00192F17F1|nr:uncharacterized protein K02A2.6-like [Crotalus tigris]
MAAYNYRLVHKHGKKMGHTDTLSRLPLPNSEPDPAPAACILSIQDLPKSPFACRGCHVLNWVLREWPGTSPGEEFHSFIRRQDELSAYKGCILWGNRVIVPHTLRARVLESLYEGHPGIVRMKALVRSYLCWPGLDKDIEAQVKGSQICQQTRPEMPQAPIHCWEIMQPPWSRIHINYARPFQGQVFLIVVDNYSKWLEVAPVPTITTARTIQELCKISAMHGLPDVIVSDNGAQFTAAEFQSFLQTNMIRHATSAPFHTASNGQAEQMVKMTKEVLKRIMLGD